MDFDLNLPPSPYDDYGAIECFIEGYREDRRVYVTKAPDKTLFEPLALVGPLATVEGTVTLDAVNGRVVYRITGVTERGALLGEKVENTLTPYLSAP